jgi:multiple sugar transport system ATP-binding protein
VLAGEAAARFRAATIGIRPEHMAVVRGGGDWQGVIAHVEHLGADSFVYVELPEHGLVTARVLGDTELAAGDAVGLTALPGAVHRFDAAGLAMTP